MAAAAPALEAFAAAVGDASAGPVACAGGRTQWAVGGQCDERARLVTAPAGVVAHEPGEMIVRVRAGTTLAALDDAVAAGGQLVPIESDQPELATVGGVLACGRSGVRRLGRGPVRDCVLEVTAVTSAGTLVRAGAPLVKNVTGFDLCRLLVGSVGTLAFIAEVVLRCHPRPAVERWWRSDPSAGVDPFAMAGELYRPLSVLWDGASVWVGLAGRAVDVADQAATHLRGFAEVEGPPQLPSGARRSLAPAALRTLPEVLAGGGPGGGMARSGGAGPGAGVAGGVPGAGVAGGVPGGEGAAGEPGGAGVAGDLDGGLAWVAEVGVGVVHCSKAAAAALPVVPASCGVAELHRRLKARFDPTGRMNPGRSPLAAGA